MKRLVINFAAGISIFFCASHFAAADVNGINQIMEEIKLFSKALNVILEGYVKPVDPRTLFYEAAKGMVASLQDPHSQFIDKDQFEALQIHIQGEYSGIGAKIKILEGFPIVEALQSGSAAEKAGIIVDDKILKINHVSMEHKTAKEISSLLRGEESTPVLLTIWRPVAKAEMDIQVVREKIELQSVKDVRIVGKTVGYFRIEEFQNHTSEQVDRALSDLNEQGMKALIIDLRSNSGGVFPQALELAERYMEKDTLIVSVESKIPEQRKIYKSSGKKVSIYVPTIVLINEASASASEIFSAAMQDHKKARLIGQKTFGKASVQSVIPMDEKTAIKLTTARYIRPNGAPIDGIGVVPDEIVQNGPAGDPKSDQQILRALVLFKEFL